MIHIRSPTHLNTPPQSGGTISNSIIFRAVMVSCRKVIITRSDEIGKEKIMASLIVRMLIELLSVIPYSKYYLNSVSVRFRYLNGAKTDQIAGYVYTVTNTETFDQIHVLVEQDKPLITSEALTELQQEGKKVFVEFDNAVIKPYYSERTKSLEDSIKADAVRRVTDK